MRERPRRSWREGTQDGPATAEELLVEVAKGDQAAFERLYPMVAGAVWGMVRRLVRDPAQSEEVAQEVLVEIWRTAPRYDPSKGSALTWALTMAHRRAVDRVRSAQARVERETRVGAESIDREFDQVAEAAMASLEHQQVRRCLGTLTELQRESVQLAYYGGRTYSEVATLLRVPLGTVKTRLRDGLIRLRDCLGVS
ncbi:MAG: ECF RNA polymerase sigma factor SigK [Pseudonocardia sp.]|nr:ECF RNA polymerase sigma factor SigK [Pseudonocardia sp.]